MRTPPVLRSRSHGRPTRMWSASERGLYCARTRTLSISELTQLERAKSMIRYLPPKGTAGFARRLDRIDRRPPSPPARITARTRFMAAMLARRAGAAERAVRPTPRPPSAPLEEEARVREAAVELDHPVEVRAGGAAGHPLVGDHLPGRDAVAAAHDRGMAVVVEVPVPGEEPLGVGDHHDPCLGVEAVRPDIDDDARTRRLHGRVHRRGDVDATVEVRAIAERRLPGKAGAAELLGHDAGHRPAQRAVVLGGDLAAAVLLTDQAIDRRLDRVERLLLLLEQLGRLRGVARQLLVLRRLLGAQRLRLPLELLQLRLRGEEARPPGLQLVLLGERLAARLDEVIPRHPNAPLEPGERLPVLDDLAGKGAVLLTDGQVVGDRHQHVVERTGGEELLEERGAAGPVGGVETARQQVLAFTQLAALARLLVPQPDELGLERVDP